MSSQPMERPDIYKRNSKDNFYLLTQVIDSFNGAASKFQKYYQFLEQRVRELDLELQNKNEALEINLREKERAKSNLNNILESLTTGVVVVDLNGKLSTFNHGAEIITGLSSQEVHEREFDEVFDHNLFKNFQLTFGLIKDIQENTRVETVIHRTDKTVIFVSVSISPVRDSQGAFDFWPADSTRLSGNPSGRRENLEPGSPRTRRRWSSWCPRPHCIFSTSTRSSPRGENWSSRDGDCTSCHPRKTS